MKFVDDWKAIVRRAWSLRFSLLAFIVDGGSLVFYLLLGIVVPTWVTLLVLTLILSSMVARLVFQPSLRPKDTDIDWDAEELPTTVNDSARRMMADVAAQRKTLGLGEEPKK